MKKILASPIVRYFILVLLAVAIGVSSFLLNAAHLTRNAVPMPFGYGASVVLSGSMEPTLSVGDFLIVRSQEQYESGDIVVYQSGTMPVVHRIVSLDGETVTTGGDANDAYDKPIPVTAIKGKVIAVIPRVGHIIWALKNPVAIILMLAAALLLVEYSFRSTKSAKDAETERLKAEIRALIEELKED